MDTKPKWWEWAAVVVLILFMATCAKAVSGGG